MALYFTFLTTILSALAIVVLVVLSLWGLQAGTWIAKDVPPDKRPLDRLFFAGLVSKLPPCGDGNKVSGADLVLTLLLWYFIIALILTVWPFALVVGGMWVMLHIIKFCVRFGRSIAKNTKEA